MTSKDAYIQSLNVDGQAYLKALDQDGVFVPFSVLKMVDGNAHAALLFGQMLYWSRLTKENDQPRLRYRHQKHFWIVKTIDEWNQEMHMPKEKERTLRRCFDRLAELKLIVKAQAKSMLPDHEYTDSKGNKQHKSVTFVRLNWPVYLRLVIRKHWIKAIRRTVDAKYTDRTKWPNGIKTDRTKWPIATIPIGQNGRSSYTETTLTETTVKESKIKDSSPSGENVEFDVFALYADEVPEPSIPIKDSSTADELERSFRSDDSQSGAQSRPEGQGTPHNPGDESLHEVSPQGSHPDVLPAGESDDHDEPAPNPEEEALPESGNEIVDDHHHRKLFVARWPAFARLPDTASKWAQINKMIGFLFEGKGAKEKWTVPFEQSLSLVELYAFNTWMQGQHRQVWEKISSFETVAKYVDEFRNCALYRGEINSAGMIVQAFQRTASYEPVGEVSGAAIATLMDVVGPEIFTMKKYDPTKADRLCQEINRAAKRQSQ